MGSSASLDRSPKKNWVENAGGLPKYVREVARAIHEKRGIPLSEAIPFAIGRIKRWAAGGDNVTAETRAKAAAAIAAWERLKAKSGKLTEAEALGRELVPDENLGIPTPLLLEWLDELDGRLVEASIRRAIKRLPDGTFAPKGTGGVLSPGDKVDVPHRSGRGTVTGTVMHRDSRGARVRLEDGPDAGDEIAVKPASKPTKAYTSELYRDDVGHEVWRIKDPNGKVVQSGISSDHDMAANLKEYNAAPEAQRIDEQLNRLPVGGSATINGKRVTRSVSGFRVQRTSGDLTRAGATKALASRLVEAANPPKRVDIRTKGGRTLNVTVEHARRIHAGGFAAADQRPGANGGKFDEAKHKRGGKGSREGGQFVSKGSSGTEVRAVQRRVGARVDGAFGDRTTEAVKRFQKSHGLVVDGIVGKQTVAAMRGRRDAKRVATGALSKRDREYLAGHIRGTGRRQREGGTFSTTIVEAVAAPAFLERVQALQPGEMARLPDGGAVKHETTPDSRPVWTSGRPSTYGEGMSWDEQRRTPTEAVADALTRSAGSTDPASLGGPTRFGTYTRVAVNGTPARFAGVNVACQPLVRYDGDGDPVVVSWTEVMPMPRLVE